MRGLAKRAGDSDPEVAAALRVIATFDDLISQQASVEALVTSAAQFLQTDVCVTDLWNDRFCGRSAGGGPIDPRPHPEGLLAGLPPYGAAVVDECLATNIQTAGGAIGVAWARAREQQWSELDAVVIERLAAGIAIDAVHVHQQRLADQRVDSDALITLVTSHQSEADTRLALRRARLAETGLLTAIHVSSRHGAIGSQVSGRLAHEILSDQGVVARSSNVGEAALVIAVADRAFEVGLASIAENAAAASMSLVLGVGSAESPFHLAKSWERAIQASMLAPASDEGAVICRYESLGALGLLAHIPSAEVTQLEDILVLRKVMASVPEDLRLLELYCEAGSMRPVAQAMHLHHSSVDYRLKRLARDLGFDVSTTSGRLRALLAVKLLRIEQARGPL